LETGPASLRKKVSLTLPGKKIKKGGYPAGRGRKGAVTLPGKG